jgi:hypothetical protein
MMTSVYTEIARFADRAVRCNSNESLRFKSTVESPRDVPPSSAAGNLLTNNETGPCVPAGWLGLVSWSFPNSKTPTPAAVCSPWVGGGGKLSAQRDRRSGLLAMGRAAAALHSKRPKRHELLEAN